MMKRTSLAPVGIVMLVVAVSSCSRDATAPASVACEQGTTSVDAKISVGDSVVFDWSPRCALAMVTVQTVEGQNHWWVAGFNPDSVDTPNMDANRIVPRLTFGRVPLEATNSHGPDPLVAGTTYMLGLWRILPPGSPLTCQLNHGDACLVGVATFKR